MTELDKHIQQYFGASHQELASIGALFQAQTLSKGDFFLRAGRYDTKLGFVRSGILREFVQVQDKEVTKWIATQGSFTTDLAGLVFGRPARWHIQALTDCELYVIERASYLNIAQSVPRWPELEKLFIAKCFVVLEERVLQHLSMTAEERYAQLFSHDKALFNRVPLQYLASMLGMTPETLSRIRKKSADK